MKHFVELGEVQFNRQLKGAADLWLDVEDVDIGGYDEGVGIEGAGHDR
jgi:hypothetical protein